MKEIRPFESPEGLAKSLDNGGYIFNFFSKANDNIVSSAELAKAANVFSSELTAFLHLEMAAFELSEEERQQVIAMLEKNVRQRFEISRAARLTPNEIDSGRAGKPAIVSGHLRYLEDRTQFSSFVMIPISAGSVTTFTMIPIYDQFYVYEVFESEDLQGQSGIVTTAKTKKLDTTRPHRFAGILRELKNEEGKTQAHQQYLEVMYYSLS